MQIAPMLWGEGFGHAAMEVVGCHEQDSYDWHAAATRAGLQKLKKLSWRRFIATSSPPSGKHSATPLANQCASCPSLTLLRPLALLQPCKAHLMDTLLEALPQLVMRPR